MRVSIVASVLTNFWIKNLSYFSEHAYNTYISTYNIFKKFMQSLETIDIVNSCHSSDYREIYQPTDRILTFQIQIRSKYKSGHFVKPYRLVGKNPLSKAQRFPIGPLFTLG